MQKTCKSNQCKILLLLVSIITMVIITISSTDRPAFAVPPSFGHQEIRDELFDLIDMKSCLSRSNDATAYSCGSTQEANQSIDIVAIDYFSNGKILNSTIWLVSRIKNISLGYQDAPSYGAFIDADSKVETGWQGIDYQIEIVWNNGIWNKTLYQFSSIGHTRILKQENQTAEELYKINNNYVIIDLDLTAIGSPDKYKIMFYAEDKKRDSSIHKTDFSSWIDIPRPDLTLSTTPSTIELRPNNRETIGIQLTSNTGFTPEVSNFIIEEKPANIQLNLIGIIRSSTEPAAFEITIPDKISTGKYTISILANMTQKSTIPNLPIQHVNLGYSFEKMDLPVTVLRSFTWEEDLINRWTAWGPILSFIIGVITGKLGSAILEMFKRLSVWKQLRKHIKNKDSKGNINDKE